MSDNKVSLLKISKKVSSKLELAKSIINITIAFGDIKLSKTAVTVLAYFMVYGVKPATKELIVRTGVCGNISHIKTIMVKLKKLELIYRDDISGRVNVSKALDLSLTPTVGMYIKLDTEA